MTIRAGKHRTRQRGTLATSVLDDIVRRIVEVARPQQIVLFGSAARGTMGPDSDVDLLVIKAGRFGRDRLTTTIYRRLSGAGAAVDVVVVTPEEVARYRDTPCLVICPALREGKVVYAT
ncbi:MAG: nucleotidyltransferase domain-containing protein [Thermoguttaceae bacterium]|jgi:predicted nucleotidyltransferase